MKLSVVGLGYVGMPIAITFAERGKEVIGYDISKEKINLYKKGIDPTNEIGNTRLSQTENIIFTNDEDELNNSNFFIIAVPTPVRADKVPDLIPVINATNLVARHLKKGDYVVFESTVFPGATEEVCVPILEEISGLKFCKDFKVGYSPERINPGDQVHRLETIIKVVAGCDEESLNQIAKMYEIVIDAGVYKASSIKVAEAAKVIENTQRDLNIAFMNELSIIFDKLNIDTLEVLEAAGTKWNFLNFRPGLVGGHCIGVDPYYLTYKAQTIGYHPQMILSGRRLNDGMGKLIAEKAIKNLIKNGVTIKGAKVLLMGLTFKENCPDLRNSKVVDIINELSDYGVEVIVVDPIADKLEAKKEYDVDLIDIDKIENVDGIIIAVAHKEYKSLLPNDYIKLFKNNLDAFTLIDVKSILDKNIFDNKFDIWRL
jgi:UDP-N-acetyl-D-galactosamine dehydrogenase